MKDVYYNKEIKFFDLADWLVFKTTGYDVRSTCTTTCKWTYDSYNKEWNIDFFEKIGFDLDVKNKFKRFGEKICELGTSVGNGISKKSSIELGLIEGLPVSTGIIDAHSGVNI
jgi:D-ribulokinase